MLRTFVLALHNDTAGFVGHADRRISLVDMLATSTAGSVSVHAHLAHVEFDLDVVINLR